MTIVGYGYGLESPPFAVTSAVNVALESPLLIEADTGTVSVEVLDLVVTIEVIDPPTIEVNE